MAAGPRGGHEPYRHPTSTRFPGRDHECRDSRASDVTNATIDAPGANDNATGMAGVLEAELFGGFSPMLGDSVQVMSYTSRGGTIFDEADVLLSTSLALAPLFTDTSVTLRASVPGDLDLDNRVSIGDLTIFATHFGAMPGLYSEDLDVSSWQIGDFNSDGTVSIADLTLLADNFGFELLLDGTWVPGSGLSLEAAAAIVGIDISGAISVPEPTAIILLALSFIACRRQRYD